MDWIKRCKIFKNATNGIYLKGRQTDRGSIVFRKYFCDKF